MNHPFGNSLVVEMGHLLAEMEVLHQSRAVRAGLKGIIGAADLNSLVGCKPFSFMLFAERVKLAVLALVIDNFCLGSFFVHLLLPRTVKGSLMLR
jgi:hypothetical protein